MRRCAMQVAGYGDSASIGLRDIGGVILSPKHDVLKNAVMDNPDTFDWFLCRRVNHLKFRRMATACGKDGEDAQ